MIQVCIGLQTVSPQKHELNLTPTSSFGTGQARTRLSVFLIHKIPISIGIDYIRRFGYRWFWILWLLIF